ETGTVLGRRGFEGGLDLRVLIVAVIAAAVLLDPVLPACADGLVQELKIGVLDHDVPNLWSGFRAEPNSADINVEAIFSPSIAFLGGTISPALGASISTIGATSDAYLDARWQMETGCGIFLGLGIGGAVHDGQLQL